MKYPILTPPIEKNFRDMSAVELEAYRRWFFEHLLEVEGTLENAVRETKGFEMWVADLQTDSLDDLGRWMHFKLKEGDESNGITSAYWHSRDEMNAQDVALGGHGFSLAADAGIYLGRTLEACCKGLSWKQQLVKRNEIDYGKMVLSGFEYNLVFEPIRMGIVLAYGILRGKKSGSGLRSLYEYWANRAYKDRH